MPQALGDDDSLVGLEYLIPLVGLQIDFALQHDKRLVLLFVHMPALELAAEFHQPDNELIHRCQAHR